MKESAREIKTSILSKLKEEERNRYEQVFDSNEFSQAVFEEKYLPLLVSSIEFLPRLRSALLVSIAIDSLPESREELLVAYLRTWRPEEVISFHKVFYKDRKLLLEYGELGKIALFERLSDEGLSTALNQMRKLRNISSHGALHIHIENFINIIRDWNISRQFNEKLEEWKENPSVEAIREVLSQVRQKLGKTIDDIERILEDSVFTLTSEGEPAIRTSGREIRLSPLFTGRLDGYTLDLKTYVKKGEEKCTYTNGIYEELEASKEINSYIDVAIKLRVEEMNYTGTPLKIGYETYKSNNNKYSVRLELRREEETAKILWLEEETGEAEIDGLTEGEYTIQAVVVKKGEETKYESAKEKKALEKAYASARFRVEEMKPGKAVIKRIHDIPGRTLLENREDELKIEIGNTGNTKLEIEVGLEGYDAEHFEVTQLEEKLKPYQDKTVFLKIKAIRTESNTKEYSLGFVKVSCCNGETKSNSPIHLKIEKNFNSGGFIDRKEQLDKAGEELDPQRRGEGIRTIWVSGEAGQGKTRFMRRLEELFDDKCAVVTLSWELEKEVDIVSFAERLIEELGKRLGWKTSAMNRLEGFRPQRREEIEEGAKLAVDAISSLAKEKKEKVLLQIDDAHKVTTTDEGSHFMKKLIESMKDEREGIEDIDVRCFIYTRKASGLGFVGENSLIPFESAQERIELMELKEGAVEERAFENVEELVWGILTDVFKPEEFENIGDDFRRLLARKSGGNPLILQLLLERYFKEGAISWDEEKWIVRESKEKLGAMIPEGKKLKERLIIDKLHSYKGDGKKLIHLLGMLGVVKGRDLKINGIGEATVRELEGRILEKGEDGYTFSHNLYSEYWEEEIGGKSLEERKEIEELERRIDKDWGEGYREKLWRYISLEGEAGERLKSEREELERETKELRRTLYTEGLSEDRLRELNDSRAVLEAIGEFSEKGWKKREIANFRGDMRYGYWLMGTREKIEEENEEKDTALEVIALVAGVINLIKDKQPDALYSLEFIQDGEYVVEKIFERGKERLEETGRIVPQAIYTIASAMVNRGNPKAEGYYIKAIEVYDKLLESGEGEGFLNDRGISLQGLAGLHAKRGLYEEAESKYRDSILSYDRAIELNENYADYQSNRGNSLQSLAGLHAKRGLYEEAERECRDSIASHDRAIELNESDAGYHNNRGASLQGLAVLHAKRGLYEEAESEYRDSILSYDRAIELNENYADYQSNRGISLQGLAVLHAKRGLYEEAESEYRDSILSYDRAIELNENYAGYHNNRGISLQGLADLHARRGKLEEAAREYRDSILSFDRAIELNESDADYHSNRGSSLQSLAYLHEERGLYEDAESEHRDSILSYDRAIELNESDADYQSNRGTSLKGLAGLHAKRGLYEEAESEYRDSIASCDRAIELNGNDAGYHNNRGSSLQSLAGLHAVRGLYEEAEREYRDSIASHDRAIELNESDADYQSNRGTSLQSLAGLHAGKRLYEEAESEYRDSIASYDRAIELNENYAGYHNNRGNSLQSLAYLHAGRGKFEEAAREYRDSILSFDRAIELNESDADYHSNRGSSLQSLAYLHEERGLYEDAESEHRDSIASHDRAIELNESDADYQSNRGTSLKGLAGLHAKRGLYEEAESEYRDSIASCDRAIELNENDAGYHNNRGSSLQGLAYLHAGKGLYEEAEREYIDSIASYDRAIELNENYAGYHDNRGSGLRGLAYLHAGKGLYEEAEREYIDSIASCDRAVEMTDWKIFWHIYFKAMTHEKYAQLLFQMDRKEEGEAQFCHFIHAMYRLGSLEEENGNRERAMSLYKRVIATIIEGYREREAMNLRRHLILILCHKRLGRIMTELGKGKKEIREEYENALNLIEMALEMELDESTKKALENEKREIEKLMNDLDS